MDRRGFGTAMVAGLALLGGAILPAADAGRPLAAPRDAPGAAAPQARTPLAGGPPPDLNLAFTAQAIGWIEPCG